MYDRRSLIGMLAGAPAAILPVPALAHSRAGPVLRPADFKFHVDAFNAQDDELYRGSIPNSAAWTFLKSAIPWFECSNKDVERTYYFRWWSYRKHIRRTADGYVVTEFLPDVPWAGKHNTISCAAAHHFYEGRWLRPARFLDEYSRFWFSNGGDVRRYSGWLADAVWRRYLVTGDARLPVSLLPSLVANYRAWEISHLGENGLFWQIDDRDGMEKSIGGNGYRPTINSYMFGDARAIARIARLARAGPIAAEFEGKASQLKTQVQERLWDPDAQFFKVRPREPNAALVDVRELHGFTPWYFNLPDIGYEAAWRQLTDPEGFMAPFGPTSAERRHPGFRLALDGHECQWNGPSWPFATSVTLTAMANLLRHYRHGSVSVRDYYDLFMRYTASHRRLDRRGRSVPWIDENLHPITGDWLSRTILAARRQEPRERGKDYNHSTYCDLLITGIIGFQPGPDGAIVVAPLLPEGAWSYFCLDALPYRGRLLTILYDRDGTRYGRGRGLQVLADGVAVPFVRRAAPGG